MPSEITVFPARRIITMDPGRPTATAVAVRDGRIISVGTCATMRPWLDRHPYEVDDTFIDKILMPGFVDPHTHLRWSGCMAGLNYVGPIESPTGVPALPTRRAVPDRLRDLDRRMSQGEPLFAWGFAPHTRMVTCIATNSTRSRRNGRCGSWRTRPTSCT